MADDGFSRSQAEALIAKLNAMDFTDEERSMLHAVFQSGAQRSEVEGFMDVKINQVSSTVSQAGDKPLLSPELIAGLLANLAWPKPRPPD